MKTITKNHNEAKCKFMEPSCKVFIYKTNSYLGLREHCGSGGGKIARTFETGSLRWLCISYITSDTHKVSLMWLNKYELKKSINSRHAKVDCGKPTRPQSYRNNFRQLRIVWCLQCVIKHGTMSKKPLNRNLSMAIFIHLVHGRIFFFDECILHMHMRMSQNRW